MTPQEQAAITKAVRQYVASPEAGPARFDGLSQVISGALVKSGVTDLESRSGHRALLAAWLQESTMWDLIVFRQDSPVLAVTYISSRANSDRGDVDRQTDRALGVARDTQLAQLHGILPSDLRRAHVHVHELAVAPDKASSEGTSGLSEAVTTSQRMRDSDLYDLVWVIGVTRDPLGFCEPADAVAWDRFAADLCSGIA